METIMTRTMIIIIYRISSSSCADSTVLTKSHDNLLVSAPSQSSISAILIDEVGWLLSILLSLMLLGILPKTLNQVTKKIWILLMLLNFNLVQIKLCIFILNSFGFNLTYLFVLLLSPPDLYSNSNYCNII